MNTLEELNNYGATLLTVLDQRLAKVTFENEPITIPDVIYNFAGVSSVTQFDVINQVNIVDISNYVTCNVRYRATIIPASGSPAMSLIWNDIPAHVTLSQSGYQYTLSGIQTAADWDRIKTFKWQVPANVNSFNFYLKIEVLWYDEETASNKVKSWNAYDPARFNFYYGNSACVFTSESIGSLVFGASANNNAVFGSDAIGTLLYAGGANDVATFSSTGNLTYLEGVSQATFTSTASGDVIELYDGLEVQFDVTPTGSATNEVFTGIVIGSTSYDVYRDGVFLQTTTVATNQTPAEFNIQSWIAYSTGVAKSIQYKIVANSGLDPVKFLTMGLTIRTTPGALVTTCVLTKILKWSGWTNDIVSNNSTYNSTYLNSQVVTFNPILGTAAVPSTVTQVPSTRPKGPKWGGLFRSYPKLRLISPTIAQYDASNATDFRGLFESSTSDFVVNDDFSSWNPVNVTDMRYMCYKATGFNAIISDWNTSSNTNMSFMFYQSSNFNRALNWNTANVTDMRAIFYQATAFNGAISSWNTSSVTNLRDSFQGATAFNQPIGSWDTSNVTNLQNTFNGATAFNQPLNTWNTGNVTNMMQTFYGATAFNQPLGAWNTSKVTTFEGMFRSATVFNGYIAPWNTALVTTTKNMFNNARAFNENIMNWDVSVVTDMSGMFSDARAYDQPLNSWNTGNVLNMSNMFSQEFTPISTTAFNQPLGAWNTSKVTTFEGMFKGATSFNQPINTWNTGVVTTMKQMFTGATSFNQTLSSWNTSSVTNMESMFGRSYGAGGLEETNYGISIFNQNISSWNTSAVTSIKAMFKRNASFNQNIGAWKTSNITSNGMVETFFNASAFNQNLSQWCVSTILTKPSGFDTGATAWTNSAWRPVWGTCPNP